MTCCLKAMNSASVNVVPAYLFRSASKLSRWSIASTQKCPASVLHCVRWRYLPGVVIGCLCWLISQKQELNTEQRSNRGLFLCFSVPLLRGAVSTRPRVKSFLCVPLRLCAFALTL